MIVSENIRSLTADLSRWKLYRNRSCRVLLQIADPQQIYNVPGRAGVVYNEPEDAYETVREGCFVVTGVMGEMWVIPPAALPKYNIDPAALTRTPQPADTIETDAVYAGIRIPAETEFTLVTDYGELVTLRGNRRGFPHGEGDFVLCFARQENGIWVPDPDDLGRIVNGTAFPQLYRPFTE